MAPRRRRGGRPRSPYEDLTVLVDAVRDLVADVVTALPPGTVTVHEEPAASWTDTPSTSIELRPHRTGAARVSLTPEGENTVFVGLGEHGWVEVYESDSEWHQLLPGVRRLVQAAVDGQVQERIWTRRGRQVHALVHVRQEGRWRLTGLVSRPLLRWGLEQEDRRYLPWVERPA